MRDTVERPNSGYRCSRDVDNPCFGIDGTTAADGSTIGGINNLLVFGSDEAGIFGSFDVLFSGAWFLDGQRYGGSTEVPEPGMLGLLMAALAAVGIGRRRRRLVTA